MTFTQLYGERLTIELGTNDVLLFTTARRKQATNNAQDNFARVTGCTRRYANIPISDGVSEYDLESFLSDYMRLAEASPPSIKRVDASGNVTYIQGDDFQRRDPEWLDRAEPGWRAVSASTPANHYVREDGGATFLGLYPGPDVGVGETWTLLVPYVADPPDLSADSDQPFTLGAGVVSRLIPYHQALVHYAAAELEPLRKNYSGVTRQMQLYNGYVAQYLEQRNYDMPDQITFARNYFGETRRGARALDPRRFP